MTAILDPTRMLRPRRKITGVSAVLLPFAPDGQIDWPAFDAHVRRTAEAGLTPAVNMDTGYVHLLDTPKRRAVLRRTREILGNAPFVAGAFVGDKPGDEYDRSAYLHQMELISSQAATPVVFPSYGLAALPADELLDSFAELTRHCDRFIAFELGTMFAPFGKIFALAVVEGLMKIPQCVGIKHSSLDREQEWQRLQLRDRVRPDFTIYTGNDLAIDMVMYGSDYLLGLSTFAPDFFALRDHFWENGDPAFYEVNDVLQYLGSLAFRDPVPAYRHSAAMFLKLRGWIGSDAVPPNCPTRPESDRAIMQEIIKQLGIVQG